MPNGCEIMADIGKQLTAINQIIILCDKMLDYIKRFGIIRENNELYCAYKEKINSFLDENNMKIRDYAPYAVLEKLFFHNTSYTVSLSEANMIRDTVIKIKHELFSHVYERIFISHREKDKTGVAALIDLLHAMGIPRTTAENSDSVIFCSSHPDCYIKNGEKNLDEIRDRFHDHYNTFYILWYSDNYFISQACLNEVGAIWAMKKSYQEILVPGFATNKIGGMLDKQPVWFFANDKFRLNTFKEQIEKRFNLPTLTQNAWEIARDAFIDTLQIH